MLYAVYDLIILYKITSADDMDDVLLACCSMYVVCSCLCTLVKNHD